MRNTPNVRAEQTRTGGEAGINQGTFHMEREGLMIIVSDGLGWDHVSVSRQDRCPSWVEMCKVKKLFFRDDEVPYQLHKDGGTKRNISEFCLHLWRDQNQVVSQPPLECV